MIIIIDNSTFLASQEDNSIFPSSHQISHNNINKTSGYGGPGYYGHNRGGEAGVETGDLTTMNNEHEVCHRNHNISGLILLGVYSGSRGPLFHAHILPLVNDKNLSLAIVLLPDVVIILLSEVVIGFNLVVMIMHY